LLCETRGGAFVWGIWSGVRGGGAKLLKKTTTTEEDINIEKKLTKSKEKEDNQKWGASRAKWLGKKEEKRPDRSGNRGGKSSKKKRGRRYD